MSEGKAFADATFVVQCARIWVSKPTLLVELGVQPGDVSPIWDWVHERSCTIAIVSDADVQPCNEVLTAQAELVG